LSLSLETLKTTKKSLLLAVHKTEGFLSQKEDFSVSYGSQLCDKSKKNLIPSPLFFCCQWANKNAIGRMVGCREFILCVDSRERGVKCGRREQLLFPSILLF
jgi:hypothetical protein